MRFDLKEKLFLSWAGLRGAVPIVLATFPMISGLSNSQLFFNVVFFVVLTSALVQGSTISFFAEKLKLSGAKKETPIHSLELVSIGKANAEVIEVEISEDNALVNLSLAEIMFPKDVLVNAIIRNGNLITPYGETRIFSGDILYVLVSKHSKQQLKNLLDQKRSEDPVLKEAAE